MRSVWEILIDKGRVGQWIVDIGGVALCIIGGRNGFLTGAEIFQIFALLAAGTYGIERLRNSIKE